MSAESFCRLCDAILITSGSFMIGLHFQSAALGFGIWFLAVGFLR
jgi:hypothetical protein